MEFVGIMYVLLFLMTLSDAKRDFSGDQILTLLPKTDAQALTIRELEHFDLVDFWSPKYGGEVRANVGVDIHFVKSQLDEFKSLFKAHDIEYKVKVQNLQALVDNQLKERNNPRQSFGYDYNVYHNMSEIYEWVEDIAAAFPSLVTLDIMGQSTEGRDVYMIKISTNPDNPAVMIDCTFHAREWISAAFCQCFTRNLLEGYGKDPVFTRHLDRLNFYIIPVVNVDGYVFSWEQNRMWRKTRSNYGTNCTGVDPNRNCDANWGGQGASADPCDITYHGPYVESEPEVKAFSDFIRQNKDHIMVYLSFHSYGQLFSLPYSYTFAAPPTARELNKYAEEAANAMKRPFGTIYTYGQGSSALYLVSGGTKDFVYDAGVPFSTTIELRDSGEYGFLLPEDQIEPTCIETTAGVRTLSDAALELWHNSRAGK